MQKRAEYVGLYIDRSVFFNILDKNILQLCDGVKRLICRKEAATVVNMTTSDGLVTIRNLNYEFKDEYINVYSFQTMRDPRMLRFEEQNIAVESKIRLEKEDVKNILDVKMNKNIGIYQPRPQSQPQPRPQPRPQTQPYPQQPYPQQQYQRAPVQPQNIILPNPPPPQSKPQPQQPQQLQQQHIRKSTYRGIGMGGVRLN